MYYGGNGGDDIDMSVDLRPGLSDEFFINPDEIFTVDELAGIEFHKVWGGDKKEVRDGKGGFLRVYPECRVRAVREKTGSILWDTCQTMTNRMVDNRIKKFIEAQAQVEAQKNQSTGATT